jgi:hypothetical protein
VPAPSFGGARSRLLIAAQMLAAHKHAPINAYTSGARSGVVRSGPAHLLAQGRAALL